MVGTQSNSENCGMQQQAAAACHQDRKPPAAPSARILSLFVFELLMHKSSLTLVAMDIQQGLRLHSDSWLFTKIFIHHIIAAIYPLEYLGLCGLDLDLERLLLRCRCLDFDGESDLDELRCRGRGDRDRE